MQLFAALLLTLGNSEEPCQAVIDLFGANSCDVFAGILVIYSRYTASSFEGFWKSPLHTCAISRALHLCLCDVTSDVNKSEDRSNSNTLLRGSPTYFYFPTKLFWDSTLCDNLRAIESIAPSHSSSRTHHMHSNSNRMTICHKRSFRLVKSLTCNNSSS